MIAVKNKKLHVVTLLDGRPGHEKQTKGIVLALQRLIDLEVQEIVVAQMSWLSLLRQAALLFLPGKGISDPRIEGADLLLGTGSRTHLPLLLFKKHYNIPAVTCMSPAFFLRSLFDLCFVPLHDGLKERHNIVHTIGAPNCSCNRGQHKEECGLILLGGVDVKSHYWETKEIVAMVRQILLADQKRHWIISSSPRTPLDTVQLMQALATECTNAVFFDYKSTSPGWIEMQYDKNQVVWVTADSISMIYEALSAGCKVGIIPMQWKKRWSKFKRNEDLLIEKGLVISFSSWIQGSAIWRDNIELNEAHCCAEWIVKKWWGTN
jgi:uncharacterized protein